jgi:hypothetical protein
MNDEELDYRRLRNELRKVMDTKHIWTGTNVQKMMTLLEVITKKNESKEGGRA